MLRIGQINWLWSLRRQKMCNDETVSGPVCGSSPVLGNAFISGIIQILVCLFHLDCRVYKNWCIIFLQPITTMSMRLCYRVKSNNLATSSGNWQLKILFSEFCLSLCYLPIETVEFTFILTLFQKQGSKYWSYLGCSYKNYFYFLLEMLTFLLNFKYDPCALSRLTILFWSWPEW
jgi:hypothetical protein